MRPHRTETATPTAGKPRPTHTPRPPARLASGHMGQGSQGPFTNRNFTNHPPASSQQVTGAVTEPACAVHVCNNQFSEASELKIDT